MSLDSQIATNIPAPNSAQDPIDARLSQLREKLLLAVQSLDREQALTIVGHPHPTAGMIGDIAGLTALKLPATLKIEPKDVPWLHAGSGNTCSGAKLYRCNRQLVSIPCYHQPAIGGAEICCVSCSEMFQFSDEDGNYIIKKSSMPHTKARYAPGGGVAFWQLAPVIAAAKKFGDQVATATEFFQARKVQQPDDWPPNFKVFISELFVASGVVFHNSISVKGRHGRTYPRSQWDERMIANMATHLAPVWLDLKWLLPPSSFETAMDAMVMAAPAIEDAMRNCAQAQFPDERVFVGPINSTDVLAVGFATAARWILQAKKTLTTCKVDDSTFSWGPGFSLLQSWAREIPVVSVPKRRASVTITEPSLPNDFLLSGSTLYDSQSTDKTEPFSQSSVHSTSDSDWQPTQTASTPSTLTTASNAVTAVATPIKSGYFVVASGDAPGIYRDPRRAGEAAATGKIGMLYASTEQEANDLLQQMKASLTEQLGVQDTPATPSADATSETLLTENSQTTDEPSSSPPTASETKHVSFADLPLKPGVRTRTQSQTPRAGRGRGRGRGRARGAARGGGRGEKRYFSQRKPRPTTAKRRKDLQQCMALLDEAELTNDTVTFQKIWKRAGNSLITEVRKSDFDYPNFHRWRKQAKNKKRRWFVVSSETMCSTPVTELKQASELLRDNTGARMHRFATRALADKFVSQNSTAAAKTFFVAVFENHLTLCVNEQDVSKARAEGAQDVMSFSSQQQAQRFIDAGQEWWVVWAGASTGVMNEDQCIESTCGHHAPDMQGPYLSKGYADKVWRARLRDTNVDDNSKPVQPRTHDPPPSQKTTPVSETPLAVVSPSTAEWIQAETDGHRVVYAVRNNIGGGSIHYDYTRFQPNEPPTVFCTGDLPSNLAAAERWVQTITTVQQTGGRRSFKERLTRARSVALDKESSTSAPPTGKKGDRGSPKITLVRDLTLGRRRDKIAVFFIHRERPIQLLDENRVPDKYTLQKLTPPDTPCIEFSRDDKKVQSLNSPPLMAFPELSAYCNDVVKALEADASDKSKTTLRAVRALRDIQIQEYEVYKLAGKLAKNANEYNMRAYLQWQFAREIGEVHPGGNAMAQFRVEAALRTPKKPAPSYIPKRTAPVKKQSTTPRRKPPWGCWLCESSDHYASNEAFHARLKPGESHTVPNETKKKILDRVQGQSNLSAAEKTEAVSRIKAYWKRRENKGKP